jgi:hypothetical protein
MDLGFVVIAKDGREPLKQGRACNIKGVSMIKRVRCAAAALLLGSATAAHAIEYSADSVYHGNKGALLTIKVFVSNGKIRLQTGTAKSFEILDLASRTGWFFEPAKDPKKKDTLVFDPIGAIRSARYGVGPDLCTHLSTATAPATCRRLGTDPINGHIAERWQYDRSDRRRKVHKLVWVDRSLDAIVKVQGDKVDYELLNVRPGPQPAALFANALPPKAILDKLHKQVQDKKLKQSK